MLIFYSRIHIYLRAPILLIKLKSGASIDLPKQMHRDKYIQTNNYHNTAYLSNLYLIKFVIYLNTKLDFLTSTILYNKTKDK